MWLGDWDVEAAGASGFWMPQAAGSRAPHPVSTPWERMKVEAVEAYEFKDLERKGPTSTILSISLSLSPLLHPEAEDLVEPFSFCCRKL